MPQAPLQCIKIKNRSWCQYKLYHVGITMNIFCYINNMQYSQRIPDCQRHNLGPFFKKANQINKTNPYLSRYLNGMEDMEKGKKRPLDHFDPVVHSFCSLR